MCMLTEILLFCRVIQTNEDGTSKMVLQNGQEVPLTKPFPFVTTFVGEGDGWCLLSSSLIFIWFLRSSLSLRVCTIQTHTAPFAHSAHCTFCTLRTQHTLHTPHTTLSAHSARQLKEQRSCACAMFSARRIAMLVMFGYWTYLLHTPQTTLSALCTLHTLHSLLKPHLGRRQEDAKDKDEDKTRRCQGQGLPFNVKANWHWVYVESITQKLM